MKRTSCRCVVTLLFGLTGFFVSYPLNSFARQQNSNQAQVAKQRNKLLSVIRQKREDKTKALYNHTNQTAWAGILSNCDENVTSACAQAAILQTTAQCSAGAQFFKKSARKWQWINLTLILASAGFTAVGASSLANAKVFGVLGGTTGLGAATTAVNASASGDQNGITAVNKTLQDFLTFVHKGGQNGNAPDSKTIYMEAPIYAAECAADANNAGGGGGK